MEQKKRGPKPKNQTAQTVKKTEPKVQAQPETDVQETLEHQPVNEQESYVTSEPIQETPDYKSKFPSLTPTYTSAIQNPELVQPAVKEYEKVEKKEKPEFPYKNFLEKKTVKLAPIVRELMSGVQYEKVPDGFIFDGMTRSLERGRDKVTGYFKPMFDTTTKYLTPQFPKEPMTELEFFCRITGQDFDKDWYWAGKYDKQSGDKNKPYTVHLPTKGELYDLSDPKQHVDYLVIKTHEGKWIAPSWEERYLRPTYWFALVDEKVSTDRAKEQNELKIKANTEFSKIKDSRELLAEFLIVYDGDAQPSTTTSTDFLFNQVYKIVEENPKQFLQVLKDDNREEKLLVFKALRAGAIIKRGKKHFTLGEQPLGTLSETIAFLKHPENFEFYEKIRMQVESYNRSIV